MLFWFFARSFCKTYAVVVAGSSSFKNYRHQADAFEMYNTLRWRGIPESQIVLFAYNDLVSSDKNPYPGKILNDPNGTNVHPGDDHIDFSGPSVTSHVFYSVMKGTNDAGKKLESTSEDNLLLFFNDHGAPGLLSMPRESGTKLYANELRDLFIEMKKNGRYRNLFFVIEACESGSVGEVLDIPNVLTLTASNAKAPSHAAKWDDKMNAFLSNEFTSNVFDFLRRSGDFSVKEFVNTVRNRTRKSEVCLFGDSKVLDEKMSSFFGIAPDVNGDEEETQTESDLGILMNAHAVFPASLLIRLNKQENIKKRHELIASFNREMKRRTVIEDKFKQIAKGFDKNGLSKARDKKVEIKDWKCYKRVVEGAEKVCGHYDESSFHNLGLFAELCNSHSSREIMKQVRRVCKPRKHGR